MRRPGRNGHDPTQTDHLNRCSLSYEKDPVAQLARFVTTPSPDCAVGLERQAMNAAGSNRRDINQTAYLNRCRQSEVSGGVKVAIAQLAGLAFSPSPYCAVRFERQAVLPATRDRRDRSQTAHLNRRSHSLVPGGVKVAITQLARVAVTPRPY